jgi:hypothetical protein
MVETIINGGTFIAVFAIAAPFIFVLLIISMTTRGKQKNQKQRNTDDSETDTMNEIYKGLQDLNRRINNLETLYKNKNNKE